MFGSIYYKKQALCYALTKIKEPIYDESLDTWIIQIVNKNTDKWDKILVKDKDKAQQKYLSLRENLEQDYLKKYCKINNNQNPKSY